MRAPEMRCRFERRLVSARCESSRDTGPPSRSGLFRPRALDSARRAASRQVSRRLSRARRDKPVDAAVDTSFQLVPCGRLCRSADNGRRSAGSRLRLCRTGRQINACGAGAAEMSPVACSAQFPVRRCNPLRSSARTRPSPIVCPWLLFRPSRAVWLRFRASLTVPAEGCRAPSGRSGARGRATSKQLGKGAAPIDSD